MVIDDALCNPIARFAGIALLLVLFALLSFGVRMNSLTVDEPAHLASGYAFLARGAIWTVPQRGHPLLVDAWEALPLYLGQPDIPVETLDGWNSDKIQFFESFVPFLTRATDLSKTAARTPAILLTILLAAVVYRWGMDLGGPWIGLLALGILAFDPTLLAHGRLATNDVGVTALGTLGLFLILRWTKAATWPRAAAAGLVLGATMVAKGSGFLWVVVGFSWVAWSGLCRYRSSSTVWSQVALMGALTGVVVWGMYGFRVGTVAGWPHIPVPAPRHWEGIFHSAGTAEKGIVYALGCLKTGNVWWYFPLAALIKNPLPLLIALLLAIGVLWRQRLYLHKLAILGLFSAFYLVIAITQGLNIGYRHMIPIHPLVYLVIAAGLGWMWRRQLRIGQWGIALLSVWYIFGTLRVYPDNLAFFNELVGGPANGWRYLAESNTDWGQTWEALRAFREEQGLSFAYSGPQGYSAIAPSGLWNEPLPPLHFVSEPFFQPALFPTPGDYVISANTLSGLYLVDPDNYSWFRYHAPDATIAHTLFYYHVDTSAAPNWLAQCTIPAVPLSQEAADEGFGDIGLRSFAFDCSQSWVYPDRGQARGVYALHGGILQSETFRERLHLTPARPADAFAARHLEGIPLAYRQWENQALPAFALFEWQGTSISTPLLSEVGVASAETSPTALTSAAFQTAPLPLNSPLIFLGVQAYPQGDVLELETWWQITEGPITRPLSIMAHLLDGDGSMLGVADGLGVSPLTLASGDVVVQRHRFPIPEKGTDVWLRTGGYWLDTAERWTVTGVPGGDALFVRLDMNQ